MGRKIAPLKIIMIITIIIMSFFALTIMLRFVTRQMLIKRGINNWFTEILYYGDEDLAYDTGERKNSIDWAEAYPFNNEEDRQFTGRSWNQPTFISTFAHIVGKYKSAVEAVKRLVTKYADEELFLETTISQPQGLIIKQSDAIYC